MMNERPNSKMIIPYSMPHDKNETKEYGHSQLAVIVRIMNPSRWNVFMNTQVMHIFNESNHTGPLELISSP